MTVLGTLRQDRAGAWTSLDEYLRDLGRRDAVAVAALATLLSAPAAGQKELAGHGAAGATLLEVACDLRVPKSSRLAAARCLMEAGIDAPHIGHLFVGAGDLVTDPRLGSAARRLVEGGLPAALQLGGEVEQISAAAGSFARAVQAAASAVGQERVKELLAGAPALHAGAAAGLFALGAGELSDGHRTGWKRMLEQMCAQHRRAPAAARRLGLAPPWPPNLPEAFAPMVREAEQRAEAPAAMPAKPASPAQAVAKEPADPPGKKLAPPIRRSPFRRPAGSVIEVPSTAAPQAAAPAQGAAPAPPSARAPPPPATPTVPELPWPPKVRAAPGPFADRVRAVLDDLPDAVERLCAVAEARASIASEEQLGRELSAELSREVWRGKTLPPPQAQRLRAIAAHPAHPGSWRTAARLLLELLVSGDT